MRRILLVWLLLGAVVSAQSTATSASSFGFTMTEDVATAQGFTYRLYADGAVAGTVLAGVTCVMVSVGRTDCTVKMPTFTPGLHTVQLTAANALEGPKSDPLGFRFVVVPGKPTSLKVQ